MPPRKPSLVLPSFDNGVACQIACLLLLEGDAVAVGGDGVGADIALSHIDGDELDIGVLVSSPCQRSAVQVADADDNVSAVVDSLTDHGLTVLIGSVSIRGCSTGSHRPCSWKQQSSKPG